MVELILSLIIIVVATLAYLLRQEVKEHQQVLDRFRSNPQDWTDSSPELLHSTWKKADDIVAEAELESLKLTSEKKFELKLFEKRFQERLDQVVKVIENNFSNNLDISRKRHDDFISNLEKQTLTWQDKLKDQMNSKVNALLLNFEENLTNFLARAEQESLESINLELRSARQLIDSYKSQQLSLVDENIVAVLERTMNLVLKQKLTLKDQIELVYEALEKAKLEKFFA